MTKVETGKLMAVLRGAYPMFYKDLGQDDAKQIVLLWAEMFADEPYELVAMAVKALIATDAKGFPPNIGAVKEKIRTIMEPNTMTEAEAWGIVLNAIRRSGYKSVEEFEKLPDELKRLVGSANQLREWSMMDSDTVQSVVASNFQRSYKVKAKELSEFKSLPSDVKRMMVEASKSLALEGGSEGGV